LHVILLFSPESMHGTNSHSSSSSIIHYLPTRDKYAYAYARNHNHPSIHTSMSPRTEELKTNSSINQSINQPNTTSSPPASIHPSHSLLCDHVSCLSTQPSHALAMCCRASISMCQIRIWNLDTTCHRETGELPI
jgi:hypothetical protein